MVGVTKMVPRWHQWDEDGTKRETKNRRRETAERRKAMEKKRKKTLKIAKVRRE